MVHTEHTKQEIQQRKRKPGGGRKPSAVGYVKTNINITPEASEILKTLPFGDKSAFVSEAIIEHQKNNSK